MKIQFWHSRVWDFISDFYTPLKEKFPDHTFLFPHEMWKEAPNSRESLKRQDVFLCEVSHPSTGLWIELWFASLYGIRIVCMYKEWFEISGSLKYVMDEIFEYNDSKDMIEKLRSML